MGDRNPEIVVLASGAFSYVPSSLSAVLDSSASVHLANLPVTAWQRMAAFEPLPQALQGTMQPSEVRCLAPFDDHPYH